MFLVILHLLIFLQLFVRGYVATGKGKRAKQAWMALSFPASPLYPQKSCELFSVLPELCSPRCWTPGQAKKDCNDWRKAPQGGDQWWRQGHSWLLEVPGNKLNCWAGNVPRGDSPRGRGKHFLNFCLPGPFPVQKASVNEGHQAREVVGQGSCAAPVPLRNQD